MTIEEEIEELGKKIAGLERWYYQGNVAGLSFIQIEERRNEFEKEVVKLRRQYIGAVRIKAAFDHK